MRKLKRTVSTAIRMKKNIIIIVVQVYSQMQWQEKEGVFVDILHSL